MATKKRKPVRSATKKVAKKTTSKSAKKPMAKAKKTGSVKKAAPVAKKLSLSNVDKAYTKGQLYSTLSTSRGISRKEVSGVFDDLGTIIAAHLTKKGPGQFTIPGLVKITIKHKPATKARKGINPFTGEETMFKAKPARNVVKVRPLQRLKAMV